MTKEIKFRAWDEKDNEMIDSNCMPDLSFWKYVAYDSTTPIMQFTGLKDKNGKEIYEGDIVQDIIVKMKSEMIFTDYANFGLKSKNIRDLEYEIIDPAWSETSLEVIGNIYENPELL